MWPWLLQLQAKVKRWNGFTMRRSRGVDNNTGRRRHNIAGVWRMSRSFRVDVVPED